MIVHRHKFTTSRSFSNSCLSDAMGEFADQDASPDRLLDALQLFRNAAPSVPDDDSNASSESSELGHALAEFKEDDCESAGIDSEDSPVESCETLSSLCASDAQDAISVASSDVEESHAALDADHCEVSGKHGDQGHQARKTDRTIVVVAVVVVQGRTLGGADWGAHRRLST